MSLPINALRARFEAEVGRRPVVVSAPTGSGKSTQVPRWCAARGRVLVIEPRRVACRSLAERVAQLEGTPLGQRVGYRVRDDDRSARDTAILFATPGVVLRMLEAGLEAFATVVLDEFHERSLDVDLLLALCHARGVDLVVMSATMAGDTLAEHLGGVHLAGEGRLFPVSVEHRAGEAVLPDGRDLAARIATVVAGVRHPGDVLVFLPGKAEIAAAARALSRSGDIIVQLHGGLSLDEQRAAFAPVDGRKVILATNVAETSLTLPGIGVVIDSGLVRRTRYHDGRGFLTLMPIAADSAEQRAGRAGRLGPGHCVRLWSQRARLQGSTPPEVHRESLVPLVLATAACGASIEALPFVDPPKAHAVATARAELTALGALDGAGLTDRGRALFRLPLDAGHGRLLVEAEGTPSLPDMVDLVAALTVNRPLFAGPPPENPEADLRDGGCDVQAAIRAVREGRVDHHRLHPFTLQQARRNSRRLRRMFGLPERARPAAVDRRALALLALAADRRIAHVARRRKRSVAWSNGGTELRMGRDSALGRVLETPEGKRIEAALVFDTRALSRDARRVDLLATCAMPVPLAWLIEAGVGRARLASVKVRGQRILASIEQVHAGKVLATRETVPEGQLAQDALVTCFLEGRLWPETRAETVDRLEVAALHAALESSAPPPDLETWVRRRVEALEVESGADLALLDPSDLLAVDVDAHVRDRLDRLYPRRLALRDADYAVRYDVPRRIVLLEMVKGQRKDPPPLSWLPAFSGFRIRYRHKNVERELRGRR